MQDKILKLLEEKLNKKFCAEDYSKHLINDHGLDSLDTVELIMELESCFDISISDDEAKELQSINDIFACLDKKCKVNES